MAKFVRINSSRSHGVLRDAKPGLDMVGSDVNVDSADQAWLVVVFFDLFYYNVSTTVLLTLFQPEASTFLERVAINALNLCDTRIRFRTRTGQFSHAGSTNIVNPRIPRDLYLSCFHNVHRIPGPLDCAKPKLNLLHDDVGESSPRTAREVSAIVRPRTGWVTALCEAEQNPRM